MKPLFSLLLLFLAACNDVTVPSTPPLSFRQYQPIYMSVSRIDVLEEYQSPNRPPNVEHTMPYSPADAMQLWVKQRLKAAGGTRTMQVIIKDASVIEKNLPTKDGIGGLLSVQVNRQYDARLEVELRIYGDAALSEASVNVVANRMMTVTEDLSAHERDAKFRELMKDMMATTNAELEKNIYAHLGSYVNYSTSP